MSISPEIASAAEKEKEEKEDRRTEICPVCGQPWADHTPTQEAACKRKYGLQGK
jgi:hypothetical protein